MNTRDLDSWRDQTITALYQDGICAGTFFRLGANLAIPPALVPLAHQSALAGMMLMTQLLIAEHPTLRQARTASIEGRFDVLQGFPQVISRPRSRTLNCLCSDEHFLAAASTA